MAWANSRDGDRHDRDHVVRAALPPGAVGHMFVLELENEGESATFGPGCVIAFPSVQKPA